VVAPARVAFGRLVVEGRSQGFQDRGGRRVLGGDEVEGRLLAVAFRLNECGNRGIFFFDQSHGFLSRYKLGRRHLDMAAEKPRDHNQAACCLSIKKYLSQRSLLTNLELGATSSSINLVEHCGAMP
jgi:hypothetical protein